MEKSTSNTQHKVQFDGQTIAVRHGENLRRALLDHGLSPHNGQASWLNCKGLGSCGTCAVKISGLEQPLTRMEQWRLAFPPHQRDRGLRLACQCKVTADLQVEKGEGFWGERI